MNFRNYHLCWSTNSQNLLYSHAHERCKLNTLQRMYLQTDIWASDLYWMLLLTVCHRIQPLHGRHIFCPIEMGDWEVWNILSENFCFRRSIFLITEFIVYPYTQEMSFRCHDDFLLLGAHEKYKTSLHNSNTLPTISGHNIWSAASNSWPTSWACLCTNIHTQN